MPTHPAVLARIAELQAEPEEADRVLAHGIRRFAAVADRVLRRTVLREYVAELDDAALIAVLERIDQRCVTGDTACRWLDAELAVTPSALHDLPYLRRVELYEAAKAAGLPAVSRRFLEGARAKVADDPEDNPHLEMSAGERTARARSRDRLVLDRLLHDRDPRVITALLDNPRVVELDVVRIAAMRPTAPEVLEVVAHHARWSQSYRVRKALAFNPCTPIAVARRLLTTLLRQDLAALIDSGVLSAELRAEVRERIGPLAPTRTLRVELPEE